ncbi:epithelial sodium channel subunit alpha-like [Porites lutea]|uniref:epithelial sodium channel subunit alpha-like n=1 Tax=Porites lutea TaxID=51062 RepID=UPI003CC53017
MDEKEKSEMKERSEETFVSLIKDFCGYTSAHGPERIMSAKQWIRKAFWSLLFVAAISVLGMQVRTLYNKYKSRPLVTSVTLESDTSLPFPVVTICNFNALKYDSLLESNLTALKATFPARNASSSQQRRRRRSTDDFGSASPTTDPTNNEDYENWYDWEGEDSVDYDAEYLATEKVALLMAEEDKSVLSSLGHQFEDMVLSCTFRGIQCSNFTDRFWSKYWHYKYGNCYVFNSELTSSGVKRKLLISNKAGPSHGLNLELNIEQDEYLDSFTPEAGVRVDITNQGQMPFPLERGLSLAPGFATAIGLRKVIIQREDPFKNDRCHKNTSVHKSLDLYNRMFNATYSATACKESCLAANQFGICGCMEYKFPVDKEPLCDITNRSVNICLNKVQKLFRESKLNCSSSSCPPPCWQEEFKISSSFAAWPAENYEYFFQNELEKRGKYVWSDDKSSMRKNVLKVQVFFEELNVEYIAERISYELPDFASDIGGQLGLWIGFSVLTIAEFIEFVLLIISLAIRKCSSRGSKVKSASLEMEKVNSHSNEPLKFK